MEASEGNTDWRGVVVTVDEDMHEDQLAQHKEVIKGCTHSKDKGGYAYKQGQDSTASI